METEGRSKCKGRRVCLEKDEFILFFQIDRGKTASYFAEDDFEDWDEFLLFFQSWCKSSYDSKSTEAKQLTRQGIE